MNLVARDQTTQQNDLNLLQEDMPPGDFYS